MCPNSWPPKILSVLAQTRNKSSVRQEKLPVLHTHETVEAVRPARLIVAETRISDFKPLSLVSFDPLISEKRFALKMTVRTAEILAEAVQMSQPAAVFRRIPTGDQHPLIFVRAKIITRINRVRFVHGFRCHDESLFLAGLPTKFQMTVAARAFIPEITGKDAVSLAHEFDAIFIGNLASRLRFIAAVPYTEDNPPLSGAINLHAEVTALPAARHVVRPQWILDRGHFTVKGSDVTLLGQ